MFLGQSSMCSIHSNTAKGLRAENHLNSICHGIHVLYKWISFVFFQENLDESDLRNASLVILTTICENALCQVRLHSGKSLLSSKVIWWSVPFDLLMHSRLSLPRSTVLTSSQLFQRTDQTILLSSQGYKLRPRLQTLDWLNDTGVELKILKIWISGF